MNASVMERAFRERCEELGAAPAEEVAVQARERIVAAIRRQVPEFNCRVVTKRMEDDSTPKREQYVRRWIDPADIVFAEGFEPDVYLGKPELDGVEAVVDHAVTFRDNDEFHFDQMRQIGGFQVKQIPTPDGHRDVYLVINGNHRALRFIGLGFDAVEAEVDECAPGRWWEVNTRPRGSAAFVGFFQRLGLVGPREREATYGESRMEDISGVAGWVCPQGNFHTFRGAADEMMRRFALLEQAVGPIDDPRVNVLRSRRRLAAELLRGPITGRTACQGPLVLVGYLADRLRHREEPS